VFFSGHSRFLLGAAAAAFFVSAPCASSTPFLLQQPAAPSPSDSAKALERAHGLIIQGKLDEAASLLSPFSGNNPKAADLQAELAKAYYHQRQFQKALPHFESAYQQNPEDGETAQLFGLCLYSLGRYEDAILPLEKTGSRLPHGEIDTPYLLGTCYLKTQQWEKAREAFAKLFHTAEASPLGYLMLSKMMVRQHLEDRAVPELEKALELDPRLPMAHFLLGEIYLYRSKSQLALTEFDKELEINPTVWLVYWRLGDAYARLEKYDEAEKALKQAIWLNETFTGPYILLGQIELRKGDLELAVGFLEQALKLDPRNYYAHYSLARAYQRLGRTEEAQQHFEMTKSLRSEQEKGEGLLLLDSSPRK
jgi:tetratricopeptide (TPR) repeat protein